MFLCLKPCVRIRYTHSVAQSNSQSLTWLSLSKCKAMYSTAHGYQEKHLCLNIVHNNILPAEQTSGRLHSQFLKASIKIIQKLGKFHQTRHANKESLKLWFGNAHTVSWELHEYPPPLSVNGFFYCYCSSVMWRICGRHSVRERERKRAGKVNGCKYPPGCLCSPVFEVLDGAKYLNGRLARFLKVARSPLSSYGPDRPVRIALHSHSYSYKAVDTMGNSHYITGRTILYDTLVLPSGNLGHKSIAFPRTDRSRPVIGQDDFYSMHCTTCPWIGPTASEISFGPIKLKRNELIQNLNEYRESWL